MNDLKLADKTIQEMLLENGRVVVICPSNEWKQARKREIARNTIIGVDVLTCNEFIAERWEIDGDGRTLISTDIREAFISILIKEYNEEIKELCTQEYDKLSVGVDFIRHLSSFMRDYSDVAKEGKFEEHALGISKRERAILSLAVRYLDRIRERGYLEPKEAIKSLCMNTKDIAFVFEGFIEAPVIVECLANHLGSDHKVQMFSQEFFLQERNPNLPSLFQRQALQQKNLGFTLRLAEAQGCHAEQALLANVIESRLANSVDPSDIALLVCDIAEEGDALLAEFIIRGIPYDFKRRVRIGNSLLGQALINVLAATCAQNERALSDYLMNPFSGISHEDAWTINRTWRRKRAVGYQERFTIMVNYLLRESHAGILLNAAEQVAALYKTQCEWVDDFTKLVELLLATAEGAEARIVARRILRKAQAWKIAGAGLDLDALANLTVDVSCATEENEATFKGGVHIIEATTSLYDTYNTVIITNMNNDAYPMDRDPSPFDRLETLLGKKEKCPFIEQQRERFLWMLSSADSQVVLERSRYNPEGEETIASALYDVVVELEATANQEEKSCTTGEESSQDVECDRCFSENQESASSPIVTRIEPVFEDDVAATMSARSMERRKLRKEVAHHQVTLLFPQTTRGEKIELDCLLEGKNRFSPTEIETYIECPYKWFYTRRIKQDQIDTCYGPLEKGTFLHEVLHKFYRELGQSENKSSLDTRTKNSMAEQQDACQAFKRVTPANLDEALVLIESCFWTCFEEQETLLVKNTMERMNLEYLLRRLQGFIRGEATFMPDFHPVMLEYHLGGEGNKAVYAGYELSGVVDRIDADVQGQRLAVTDYKTGSVGRYRLPSTIGGSKARSIYESKVQAAIYAQVIYRQLGIEVVASLYRSLTKFETTGCWNPSMLGSENAEALPKGGEIPRDFRKEAPPDEPENYRAFLDGEEQYVAEQLARLMNGDIRPCPRSGACTYCLAKAFCEEVRL